MRKGVDQKLAGDAPATKSIDQAMELGRGKIGDATEVTLLGDPTVFMPGFGTSDPDFFSVFSIRSAMQAKRDDIPDEKGIKFMLAFIRRIEPRDEIEAALVAQMAATHTGAMRFANRLAHAESLQEQDSADRAFNKLTRTFAAQVEALQRYRSISEHKVFVQHVSVNRGGQAIVGNVGRRDEGELKKQVPVTPALADARQAPMETLAEAQREPVRLGQRRPR
jgi:hypothetical protein